MQSGSPARVVTPEAVPLAIDIAGLGSRMIALLVDLLIQAPIVIAIAIAAAASGDNVALQVVYLFLVFAVLWGYFPLFEGMWQGRTPGKRAQSLRVVRTDGQPVRFINVLVRNLLRVVDVLPGNYAVAVIAAAVTARSQRLGDLAAGTIVVRERSFAPPAPMQLAPAPSHVEGGRGMDVAGLGEREYAVVRAFLQRRLQLAPEARATLAAQLASQLRDRVGVGAGQALDDESFLEALAVAYRERSGSAGPPPGTDPGL